MSLQIHTAYRRSMSSQATFRGLGVTAITVLTVSLTACAADGDADSADAVVALAKLTDDHGDVPAPASTPAMQVITDADLAQDAWDAHVGSDVEDERGTPDEQGIYETLEAVDFDEQDVVVWWSSQATCPSWVSDITVEDSTVTVTEATDDDDGCLDVEIPYRMLLAVDHDQLPDPAELPAELIVNNGGASVPGEVVGYPEP